MFLKMGELFRQLMSLNFKESFLGIMLRSSIFSFGETMRFDVWISVCLLYPESVTKPSGIGSSTTRTYDCSEFAYANMP